MFRNYARLENNMYVEFYAGRAYDSESLDWQPGDPSRIGLEMPINEWQPPWVVAAMVDVTDMEPQPAYGWMYNPETGLFSEPPPPYIDPRPAIMAELDQIDKASARPLRTIILANPDVGEGTAEKAELETLELRAAELRNTLENLPPAP